MLQYQSVCSACTAVDPTQRPASADLHAKLLVDAIVDFHGSPSVEEAPLIHNTSEKSTVEAMTFLLREALQKLNVPLTKPCCRLHSGMEELRKTLRELSCHACVAWLCQRSCSALYLLCFLWITSKQVEHFQLFHFGQRWHRHAASVRGSPPLYLHSFRDSR